MELILSYFPDLSDRQVGQLTALGPLYREWNEKINVISRKDIDHLYEHHVLHSLAIAKYYPIEDNMQILDVGTGGGFPGIPLAILFPDAQFTLLDSIAKKIHVVQEISHAVGLENVEVAHARVEDYQGEYDIVISRAVSALSQLVAWTSHLVPSERWIVLKGGNPMDIRKELPPQFRVNCIPVSRYFKEQYFLEKLIVDVVKK
jgi:16S rRNA (guanine527-N7)-methyltransferase